MSNIDKRALRKAAMHAKTTDDWGCDADNFHDKATPDVVLALLDELEAKDSMIAAQQHEIRTLLNALEAAEKRIAELEVREIALPPRAPENLAACLDGYEKWLIATTFRDTWNACLAEVVRVNASVISNDSAVEELLAAGIITKAGE